MQLDPRPFLFLRHGETDWNAANRSQGRTDIPLNANGLAQAAAAAERLAGAGIVRIMASPLARARRTAEIVAAPLGLPVELDPDLQEVDFGVEEGQPMGAWYDAWIEGSFTPEGAESFAALRARATGAVNRALAGTAPVLLVAHGALFRALRAAMGLPPNVRTPNAEPLLASPPGAPFAAWSLTPL